MGYRRPRLVACQKALAFLLSLRSDTDITRAIVRHGGAKEGKLPTALFLQWQVFSQFDWNSSQRSAPIRVEHHATSRENSILERSRGSIEAYNAAALVACRIVCGQFGMTKIWRLPISPALHRHVPKPRQLRHAQTPHYSREGVCLDS
jgi:hypothetical protein